MSRRVALLLAIVAGALGLTACGGSSSDSDGAAAAVVETHTVEPGVTSVTGPEGSITALLVQNPAPDSALIWGTGRYSPGENRLSFLIVNASGELIQAPRAKVRVARGGFDAIPDIEATAENLPVGAPPGTAEEGDLNIPSVYVAHVDLDQPGQYSLLVEPEGADIQAYGQLEVIDNLAVPAVGDKAPPSDNPTVEDGFPEDITTATPPDVELLQHSVKDSLEAGVPFVVTFATPKFCVSRVCGPVVDIVDSARQKLEGSGVRFIHIEVFEANDPDRGHNRWMKEWNLPTEPWTFLVDKTGTIRARFEGLVTAGELEQGVRDLLA